ncbi:MAG: DNA helicase [Pseudobdellovibrionaceae bacterium]
MFEDPQLEVSVKLSAPIYVLKAQAKELKKSNSMSMAEALNHIAQREGYSSWGLLQSKSKDLLPQTRDEVLSYLNAGDLVLVGSRPGFGKTTFTLKLILQAIREGKRCFLFTLEESRQQIAARVADMDEEIGENHPELIFDFSNEISSEYIIKRCAGKLSSGSLIAIDYLQLLDQQRNKPSLQSQIQDLKDFAKEHRCILIFISQLDRNFESKQKKRPGLEDVRLPNPLDLSLFNKAIFLHDNKIIFAAPREFELS